ncbi:hypothetical protein CTI14_70220, partial [Methylobacterium radiotolerans]
PHLIDFNERARVNGQIASDQDLIAQFQAVEAARRRRLADLLCRTSSTSTSAPASTGRSRPTRTSSPSSRPSKPR